MDMIIRYIVGTVADVVDLLAIEANLAISYINI